MKMQRITRGQMKMLSMSLAVLGLLAISLPAGAGVITVTTRDLDHNGVGGSHARKGLNADAYVDTAHRWDNFGYQSNVTIRRGDRLSFGYVRFDLASLSAPVQSVQLSLSLSYNSAGANPF